ncbi:hypothetical protein Cni_G27948 [Canna indica]|uniref:KIB1-4 beta-propeller domain-containing protein n=1 Tax=Canna indica TaxID=4628 RepID=A0AAQ3L6K6_9LILI|nr:hypothetical protein Cni_G27948 [Canna indica]
MDLVKRRRITSFTYGEEESEEEEEEEEEEVEEGLGTKKRDWSSLTDPLLHAVLRRLNSLEDFFAFRGVCRDWRAASPPSPDNLDAQPPLILLTRFPAYTEAFYDLARGRLYRAQLPWRVHSRRSIAYSRGYLVTTTEPPNARLLLWNIFSQARIRLPTAPEPFRRVLLSSHPARDCHVVLFAKREAVLQHCRIGDALWTIREWNRLMMSVDDMIFFRDNRLYALTATMQLLVVDLAAGLDFWSLVGGKAERTDGLAHRERWLAESGGELLVLCHRFQGGFDVSRWDSESSGWVEVFDLGGRAVFLGSTGFAGSIAATGLIRGNCIYFVRYRKDAWYVFSLDDQSVEVVSPDSPGLLRGESALETVWVFPSLC